MDKKNNTKFQQQSFKENLNSLLRVKKWKIMVWLISGLNKQSQINHK